MKVLLDFLFDVFFGESPKADEPEEESTPSYVYHMSDDSEVELRPSGNPHSPIE